MLDDALFDELHAAWAGVDWGASKSFLRHSPVEAEPAPPDASRDAAWADAMLTELYRFEAEDYSRYRFDQDGEPCARTRTFSAKEAYHVKEQVGSGKSHRARTEIATALDADPELRIAYAVSTAKLQAQDTAALDAATGRSWMPYLGFEREVDGVSICRFLDQAKAARRMGQDAYKTVCDGCPHQGSCFIWEQHTSRAKLWVVTHAQVRHGMKPFGAREDFDILLFDEDPTSTLLADEKHLASCLLGGPKKGKTRDVLKHTLRAIHNALDHADGRLRMVDLPRPKAISAAAGSLSKKSKVKVTRDSAPDESTVAAVEARLQAAALLRDLIDAMAMTPGPRGEVAGCTVGTDQHGAVVVDIAVPRDIHPQFANARVVHVLSATAEPILLLRSIPNIQLDETVWQPYEHGEFVYLQGAKASLMSLLKEDRKALDPGALEVVKTLARRHARLLVVAQQAVEAALVKSGLPDNVSTGHFNALEGLNDYAQFDALLILGRPLMKTADLIRQAEAAAGGFIDAELSRSDKGGTQRPTFGKEVKLKLTAKDGSTYAAKDHRHENPYLDAVRRAATFAAVAQADRSRGQHRGPDNPVVIYDATGLDNDWEIDRVDHWRSLCAWWGALEANGFVPHPSASHGLNELLAVVCQEHFKDAKAAKNHRVKAKRDHGITLETLLEDCPFRSGVVVNIKLPGSRYAVPFIVNAGSAPEAAALIWEYLPQGTEISSRARRNMRLDQPAKKEADNDAIKYELAAGSRELADSAEAAEAEDAAGECEEELVCEDGAATPPCASAGQ